MTNYNPTVKDIVRLKKDTEKKLFYLKEKLDVIGILLEKLQRGENLEYPYSKPMPTVGARCHELRFKDNKINWRIIYRTNTNAIILAVIFKKKGQRTPKEYIDLAKDRLREYDSVIQSQE